MSDKVSILFEIVGLISSPDFQSARCCAQDLYKKLPYCIRPPVVKGFLEVDWVEYLDQKRREDDGRYWSSQGDAVILINGKLAGDGKNFLKLVQENFGHEDSHKLEYYEELAEIERNKYFLSTQRTYIFLGVSIESTNIEGRMVFQLYNDIVPKTCENFRSLCTGEKGIGDGGVVLHYLGTPIHRIVKGGWIQGGDIEFRQGNGGVSIEGREFSDEAFTVRHNRRGVLSMANRGRHSNSSQFFITLQSTPWMDRHFVAFGQMVEGTHILKELENIETEYDKPIQKVIITDCGQIEVKDEARDAETAKDDSTLSIIPNTTLDELGSMFSSLTTVSTSPVDELKSRLSLEGTSTEGNTLESFFPSTEDEVSAKTNWPSVEEVPVPEKHYSIISLSSTESNLTEKKMSKTSPEPVIPEETTLQLPTESEGRTDESSLNLSDSEGVNEIRKEA